MAFDGSGVFNRLFKWTQDAANNINITASRVDGEDDGFAAGLSNCVTRDGQGKMTADFIPATDNALNLGSALKRWATLNGAPIPTTQGGIGLILYPQTSAEAGAGVTPTQYFYPPGNVLRYGADLTGAVNSYTAFANAIAVCKTNGNDVIVPAGNFKIDTTSGTLNCSYVTFLGTGVTAGAASPVAAGSVLSIVGTANSPFTIGPGVTFDGIGFFYPAQVDSFTPIVFPPTMVTSLAIAGAINFVYIQNCTVFNAYRFFVDTDATGSIGHIFVLDNTIYGVLTCFEITYNSEIITFTGNEFSFGHFLAATETGLRKYTRANGTVIQVPKTDGLTFNGNVLFGYLNGIAFNTTASLCQLSSITANYFDQVLFGILATGTGNISGMTITANSFVSFNSQLTTAIGNAIKIATTGSLVSEQITICANNFSTCTGDEINISGAVSAGRTVNINGNQFTAWGQFQASGSYGGINISSASTSYIANNNIFINQAGTLAVAHGILGSLSDGVINGNLFGACQTAINATFNAVVAIGNQSYGTISAGSNNYPASGTIVDINNIWDKDTLKVTGFGIPTGPAVVASFPGATATLLQTSQTVAELLTILKAKGIIGA